MNEPKKKRRIDDCTLAKRKHWTAFALFVIAAVVLPIITITLFTEPIMTNTNTLLKDAATIEFDELRPEVVFSNRDDAAAVDTYRLTFNEGLIFVNKNSDNYKTAYKNINDNTIEFKTPQGETVQLKMNADAIKVTTIELRVDTTPPIILTRQ